MRNLKFKHDVNTWEQADDLWREQGGDVTLCYSTWLVKSGDDYAVLHYSTKIVTFHMDGSCTINAAYVTSTTADRMHHYKPEMVERIGRRSFENGKYVGRYEVTLANHPGVVDIWEGSRYRIYPDRTVVKM